MAENEPDLSCETSPPQVIRYYVVCLSADEILVSAREKRLWRGSNHCATINRLSTETFLSLEDLATPALLLGGRLAIDFANVPSYPGAPTEHLSWEELIAFLQA